jgi:hypothetical protein
MGKRELTKLVKKGGRERMKKVFAIALSAILLLTAIPAVALADNGNGAPDAKLLYHLNIIGVKYDKNENMGSGGNIPNGNVIFVDLEGKNRIRLVLNTDVGLDADEFAVLDKNATTTNVDEFNGALLAIPDPDLDPYIVGEVGDADTESAYSVWVRPLGKPGGYSTITTCADIVETELAKLFLSPKEYKAFLNDPAALGGYASVEQVTQPITLRTNGKGGKVQFTDVTAELLTIVLKVEYEYDGMIYTVYVRVPLFDDILQNEYWEYDNNNLKLLQVRFYDCPADVSEGDGDLPPLPDPYPVPE